METLVTEGTVVQLMTTSTWAISMAVLRCALERFHALRMGHALVRPSYAAAVRMAGSRATARNGHARRAGLVAYRLLQCQDHVAAEEAQKPEFKEVKHGHL